jgi:hypothetical protein
LSIVDINHKDTLTTSALTTHDTLQKGRLALSVNTRVCVGTAAAAAAYSYYKKDIFALPTEHFLFFFFFFFHDFVCPTAQTKEKRNFKATTS